MQHLKMVRLQKKTGEYNSEYYYGWKSDWATEAWYEYRHKERKKDGYLLFAIIICFLLPGFINGDHRQ